MTESPPMRSNADRRFSIGLTLIIIVANLSGVGFAQYLRQNTIAESTRQRTEIKAQLRTAERQRVMWSERIIQACTAR